VATIISARRIHISITADLAGVLAEQVGLGIDALQIAADGHRLGDGPAVVHLQGRHVGQAGLGQVVGLRCWPPKMSMSTISMSSIPFSAMNQRTRRGLGARRLSAIAARIQREILPAFDREDASVPRGRKGL
jgi:hypothetical protein